MELAVFKVSLTLNMSILYNLFSSCLSLGLGLGQTGLSGNSGLDNESGHVGHFSRATDQARAVHFCQNKKWFHKAN